MPRYHSSVAQDGKPQHIIIGVECLSDVTGSEGLVMKTDDETF